MTGLNRFVAKAISALSRVVSVCAVACMAFSTVRYVQAQTVVPLVWNGPTGSTGDWFQNSNWLNNTVPSSSVTDYVYVENGGTAQRAQDQLTSVLGLAVGSASLSSGSVLLSAG